MTSPIRVDGSDSCYAAQLGGCGGGPSREHPFPKCMLEMIDDGDGVITSGLKWLNGEMVRLPPKAIASKVLCRSHNELLSPLDEEGKLLLGAIAACVAKARVPDSLPTFHAINARKIERLFLQVLCGSIAAGFLHRADGKPDGLFLDRAWVDALFDVGPWPGWRLAVAEERASKILTVGHDCEFGVLHLDGDIGAVEVRLAGILFVLALVPGNMPEDDVRLISLPGWIAFRGKSNVDHRIAFTWPTAIAHGPGLTFVLTGEETDLPPPLPVRSKVAKR
jgi:hypothetical protein